MEAAEAEFPLARPPSDPSPSPNSRISMYVYTEGTEAALLLLPRDRDARSILHTPYRGILGCSRSPRF